MKKILTWHDVLIKEKKLLYFNNILSFINNQRKKGIKIYPKNKDIFNVFVFTKLKDVKVVIIGQDPYNNKDQANGLSFSVNTGMKIPPSLINIYKELSIDIKDFVIPNHGFLKNWAQQGVMLLNTILTVEEGKTLSHSNIGWETFTNKVITIFNTYCNGIIFLLWGEYAKKKEKIIDFNKHYILKASHPSPFSANKDFFGCRHFSKTNNILIQQNKNPINWKL